MDYSFRFPDQLEALSVANNTVVDQNRRYEMLDSIHDDDLRELAEAGVKTEQLSSLKERESAYNLIPETTFQSWDELLAQLDELVSRSQSILERKAEIIAELDIALEISPSFSEQLKAITQTKLDLIDSEVAELENNIQDLRALELGFTAIYGAWSIPKAINTRMINVHSDHPQPLDPAELNQSHLGPHITESSFTNEAPTAELLDEPEMLRIFWAIIDYVTKAGEAGARLEQMRKELPELSRLSKIQYSQFKDFFGSINSDIEEKLNNMGLHVQWVVTGRTRGTRYTIKDVKNPTIIRSSIPATKNTVHSSPMIEIAPTADQDTIKKVPNDTQFTSDQDENKATPEEITYKEDTQAPTVEGLLLDDDIEKKEAEEQPFSLIAKRRSSGDSLGGKVEISQATLSETLRHLGCKRDKQLAKEVEGWITWLKNNPDTSASRKIKSKPGVRLFDDTYVTLPLYRFSPKDTPELKVRRQYMRNRIIYVLHKGEPAIVAVIRHDEFDRKYN